MPFSLASLVLDCRQDVVLICLANLFAKSGSRLGITRVNSMSKDIFFFDKQNELGGEKKKKGEKHLIFPSVKWIEYES